MASQVDDGASFLGGRNEFIRRQPAVFGMLPAHERLCPRRAPVGKGDLGLVPDLHFFTMECATKIIDDAQPPDVVVFTAAHEYRDRLATSVGLASGNCGVA